MSMTTNKQTLRERIEKALNDFTNGRASMHVPPLDTDVDMVLAECAIALEAAELRNAELEARTVTLPKVQDIHPWGPQSAKILCEFHRNIVNMCANEIRKVGVKVIIAAATDKGE